MQQLKQYLDKEIRVTGELINEWDREDRAAKWRAQKEAEIKAQKEAEIWAQKEAEIIKRENMGWGVSGSPW